MRACRRADWKVGRLSGCHQSFVGKAHGTDRAIDVRCRQVLAERCRSQIHARGGTLELFSHDAAEPVLLRATGSRSIGFCQWPKRLACVMLLTG